MENQASGRELCAQGNGQLASGRDVEGEPFLLDPARNLRAEERLACVVDVDVRTERLAKKSSPVTEVVLVQDVRGSVVLLGEIADVKATDGQHAIVAPLDRSRPDLWREGVDVGRHLQPRGSVVSTLGVAGTGRVRVAAHIRSGAETPSRPSPFDSTVRVASTSHSRARCRSVGSSSPTGRTRQTS